MSTTTPNKYLYTPAILRGVQIALPDGMSLGDIEWDAPTEPEEIACVPGSWRGFALEYPCRGGRKPRPIVSERNGLLTPVILS
jgi:hypothetical protein